MKAHWRHNSNRQLHAKIVVTALALVVLGVLLPKVASFVGSTVMYPVQATNEWLRNSSDFIPRLVRDRSSMLAEIQSLEQQLAEARNSNYTQQRLLEENRRFRALLGNASSTRLLASVIARPNELPYDLLQIDRGTAEGVEVGAPVFIGDDIVIGLVVHAAAHYSFVELVTTPGFKATAFISGPNIITELEGIGGGVARVRVPQGVALRPQNLVYLPSVEPGVFGRVTYVENEPTQPEQYGYLSSDIPVNSIYQVAVGSVSQISRSPEEIEATIAEEVRRTLLAPVDIMKVITVPTTTNATTSTSTP